MPEATPIEGFSAPVRVGVTHQLPVYVSDAGTIPLIVLHELPGQSESFISYCREMAAEGFKVFMPLILKSPGTEMGPAETLRFCVSREFKDLFDAQDASGARPFTAWLLELVRHVAQECPDQQIGVVGMCLTGGFAIAAVAEPQVVAVAACQPAWPAFRGVRTLGLSDTERQAVRGGLEGKVLPCVKGYRFAGDPMSRPAHMRAAADLLGDGFERFPDIKGFAHSVLTTGSKRPEVYDDVLAFMRARLGAD